MNFARNNHQTFGLYDKQKSVCCTKLIMLKNQISKKYRFTKFLSQISIFAYLIFVLFGYIFLIIICAILYYNGGVLHYSGLPEKPVDNFLDCLYFSVITQTTIGYGDILPTRYGRLIVSLQALFGTIYITIFFGLFLLRYIWTTDVVRVSKVIAFNPDDKVFRVRILNLSAFDLQDIKLKLWEHYKIESNDFISNRQIDLRYEEIIKISSMSFWRIKTNPIDAGRINSIFKNIRWFWFQIDGKYTYSNYIETFKIEGEQIFCGEFAKLKKPKQSIKDYKNYMWENFDLVLPQEQSAEKCIKCEFWNSCICWNKAKPPIIEKNSISNADNEELSK